MNTPDLELAVGVFAYNERTHICRSLDTVERAADGQRFRCYVLINGCSDDTAAVVRDYAAVKPFVEPVEIPLGDKTNAWNVFVHDVAPVASAHVFLDGDCRVVPGALTALRTALAADPARNAAAAVPEDVGWSTRRQIREMLSSGGLAGNLYALSAAFVDRLRAQKARMPIGLIGDDSLIGALACWDLEPRGPWQPERIAVCPDARFTYDPMSFTRLGDLRALHARKIRYSMRKLQLDLLRPLITSEGLGAMPAHITDLYPAGVPDLRPARDFLEGYFDRKALASMRAAAAI